MTALVNVVIFTLDHALVTIMATVAVTPAASVRAPVLVAVMLVVVAAANMPATMNTDCVATRDRKSH